LTPHPPFESADFWHAPITGRPPQKSKDITNIINEESQASRKRKKGIVKNAIKFVTMHYASQCPNV
jgi:hypothetical protein